MARFLTTTYRAKNVPRSKRTVPLSYGGDGGSLEAKKGSRGTKISLCSQIRKGVSLADSQGELTRSIPIIVQERTKIVPRVDLKPLSNLHVNDKYGSIFVICNR